jgi:allantoicase
VIIKLGARSLVQWVEVDTTYFKGNAPESCSLEGMVGGAWKELLPRQPLQAHTRHFFGNEILRVGPVTHVRFNIFPDGGVSRLRVIGKLCRDGLERLNALLAEEARAELLECCGSARWVSRMAAQRPFESRDEMLTAAELLWWNLDPLDWMEAFNREPNAEFRGASADRLAALDQARGAYRERFGYPFVSTQSGSVDEMETLIAQRLGNDPDRELRVAAEEKRTLTRQKLEKLIV